MNVFEKVAALTGVIQFGIGAIAALLYRRSAGVSLPKWVHIVALVSFLVGIGLVWQSQEVGGTPLWHDLIAPLLLPVFTYLSYGFYGARHLGASKKGPRT